MISQRDRIDELIGPPEGPKGCRRWLGGTFNSDGRPGVSNGKGSVILVSRILLAHRLNLKTLPKSILACHDCDHPWCVEVSHLWSGTDKTNMEDKVKKGRQHRPIGSIHGRAKLNESNIKKIRRDTRFEKVIAEEYGVTKSLIGQIRRKTIWKHVS